MRQSQPAWRRLLGKAFHLLASIWVVGPVDDTQCGFKGFHREGARDVVSRPKVTSIVFDVEVIHLVRRRGYSSGVLPIHWADRRGSRMHPGPRLAVRVAWDLFRIPLIHRDVGRELRGTGDKQGARTERRAPAPGGRGGPDKGPPPRGPPTPGRGSTREPRRSAQWMGSTPDV